MTEANESGTDNARDTAIAIVGGGKLGEALLSGLLRSGRPAAGVVVAEKDAQRATSLSEQYGVDAVPVAEAAARARTVILAVKPHDVDAVVRELAATITTSHVVVSVAAGISATRIENGFAGDVAVMRCMPNTPALVGEAVTAVAAGSHALDDHLALAEGIFGAVGRVVRVPESQLDAVTALSGSGPAYFFLVVEAMIEAGVSLGLPRPVASELVVQTAVGAATMLRDSGEHPVRLREAVTSPGGTTIAGLRELEAHGVRAALTAAIEAAARRSAELGG